MTKLTEDEAREYLFTEFAHTRYIFSPANEDEHGFDMWMEDIHSGEKTKAVLKATEDKFSRLTDIFLKLCFSSEDEVTNFERGDTVIVRVFLGNKPHKVFILDNSILKSGAKIEQEYRAKIVGTKYYDNITEISERATCLGEEIIIEDMLDEKTWLALMRERDKKAKRMEDLD